MDGRLRYSIEEDSDDGFYDSGYAPAGGGGAARSGRSSGDTLFSRVNDHLSFINEAEKHFREVNKDERKGRVDKSNGYYLDGCTNTKQLKAFWKRVEREVISFVFGKSQPTKFFKRFDVGGNDRASSKWEDWLRGHAFTEELPNRVGRDARWDIKVQLYKKIQKDVTSNTLKLLFGVMMSADYRDWAASMVIDKLKEEPAVGTINHYLMVKELINAHPGCSPTYHAWGQSHRTGVDIARSEESGTYRTLQSHLLNQYNVLRKSLPGADFVAPAGHQLGETYTQAEVEGIVLATRRQTVLQMVMGFNVGGLIGTPLMRAWAGNVIKDGGSIDLHVLTKADLAPEQSAAYDRMVSEQARKRYGKQKASRDAGAPSSTKTPPSDRQSAPPHKRAKRNQKAGGGQQSDQPTSLVGKGKARSTSTPRSRNQGKKPERRSRGVICYECDNPRESARCGHATENCPHLPECQYCGPGRKHTARFRGCKKPLDTEHK